MEKGGKINFAFLVNVSQLLHHIITPLLI